MLSERNILFSLEYFKIPCTRRSLSRISLFLVPLGSPQPTIVDQISLLESMRT